MSELPADLRGPVPLVLEVAQEALPAPTALEGGPIYAMKRDGFRCAAVHRKHGVRLWSPSGPARRLGWQQGFRIVPGAHVFIGCRVTVVEHV